MRIQYFAYMTALCWEAHSICYANSTESGASTGNYFMNFALCSGAFSADIMILCVPQAIQDLRFVRMLCFDDRIVPGAGADEDRHGISGTGANT